MLVLVIVLDPGYPAMSYAFLWLESLAVALLGVATVLALIARLPTRWVRGVLGALTLLLPLAFGMTAVGLSCMIRSKGMTPDWFGYALSWTIVYVISAAWCVWRVRRRTAIPGAAGAACCSSCGKSALACLVAFVLCSLTYGNLSASLERRLIAIGAESRSLAMSLAPPRVPDDRNSALVYDRASELIRQRGLPADAPKWLRELWEPGFDASRPVVLAYLREAEPVLDLLRRAAAMPDYFHDTDYARPLTASRLIDIRLREGVELLALDALSKAAQGRIAAAFSDVTAMRRMAERTGQVPQLIASMLSTEYESEATYALEDILASAKVGPVDVAAFPPPTEVSYRSGFRRALLMEEACGLMALADAPVRYSVVLRRGRDGEVEEDVTARLAVNVFMLPGDVESYQYWTAVRRRIVDKPFYERKDADDFDAKYLQSPKGILTGTLVPKLASMSGIVASADAHRRLSDLAIALTAYRVAHDEYPSSLAVLVPEFMPAIPIDPCCGRPLKMIAVDGGVVLYSTGADGKDDGGIQRVRQANLDEGDIIFSLGLAYQARWLKPKRGAGK